jgi:hypothetical protein
MRQELPPPPRKHTQLAYRSKAQEEPYIYRMCKAERKNAHLAQPIVGLHMKWPLNFSYLKEHWKEHDFFFELSNIKFIEN